MTYGDCLWHWGIKGMKWGVRRYQNADGSLTAEGKKRYISSHEDYTRAHTKKDVREMSDTELSARINRLQKEKQYNQLVVTPSTMQKAIKFAASTAAALGTMVSLYNNASNVMRIGKNFVSSEEIRKGMAATAISEVMKVNGA